MIFEELIVKDDPRHPDDHRILVAGRNSRGHSRGPTVEGGFCEARDVCDRRVNCLSVNSSYNRRDVIGKAVNYIAKQYNGYNEKDLLEGHTTNSGEARNVPKSLWPIGPPIIMHR
jgi:hypothetical protein